MKVLAKKINEKAKLIDLDCKLTLIGYDDVTFNVESKLDKILKPCYSYNCVKVNFYLNRPLEKCE